PPPSVSFAPPPSRRSAPVPPSSVLAPPLTSASGPPPPSSTSLPPGPPSSKLALSSPVSLSLPLDPSSCEIATSLSVPSPTAVPRARFASTGLLKSARSSPPTPWITSSPAAPQSRLVPVSLPTSLSGNFDPNTPSTFETVSFPQPDVLPAGNSTSTGPGAFEHTRESVCNGPVPPPLPPSAPSSPP